MTGDITSGWQDLLVQFLIAIVAGLALILAGYALRKEVHIWLRGFRIAIFNEIFKIRLFCKYVFDSELISYLQPSIFDVLKERFPEYEFSKITTRPDTIVLKPENLGVRIQICLSSVNELLSEEEDDENNRDMPPYELEITLGDELKLGYKELSDLTSYLMIFNAIKDIVKSQCFNGVNERNGFIVCDVIRNFDQITTDRNLDLTNDRATLSFMGNTLKVTLKNHEYLERVIKKYISY